MLRTIYMLFVGVGLFLAGAGYEYTQHRCAVPEPQIKHLLPSQQDIQHRLTKMGYDIGPKGVDGVIGGKSRIAWDEAYGNQCAALYFPSED